MFGQHKVIYFLFTPSEVVFFFFFFFKGVILHLPSEADASLKNPFELLFLHPGTRGKKKVRDKPNVRHVLKWKRIAPAVHPSWPRECFSALIFKQLSCNYRNKWGVCWSRGTSVDFSIRADIFSDMEMMFTAALCSGGCMTKLHSMCNALNQITWCRNILKVKARSKIVMETASNSSCTLGKWRLE